MGDTTLRPARALARGRPARTAWLTVLWHPHAARIGDGGPIAGRVRLSRLEPELGSPRGGARTPLGERHLSRTPVELRASADGRFEIAIDAPAAAELAIDGVPVVGAALVDATRGAVLELAGRVALLLHVRSAPRAATSLRASEVADRPAHGVDAADHAVAGAASAGLGGLLVGDSEAIDELRAQVASLAAERAPVLIVGETGAGKEQIARALWAESPRAAAPFVAVNMATLAPGTAAAQLFGHARGAFTGADRAVAGLFAQADGGTLFLDEVFDTPAEVQAMLLRALDAGEIRAVGDSAARRVDVRVLAATDARLDATTPAAAFRPQLYHRLAAHRVTAPTLRARPDDLGRLLAAFVARELGGPPPQDDLAASPWLPAGFWPACVRHAWPGNVRELEQVARRLAMLGRAGPISRADALAALGADAGAAVGSETTIDAAAPSGVGAPPTVGTDAAATGPVRAVSASPAVATAAVTDDDALIAALAAHGWRTGAAARALGISKTTLYARMDRCPELRIGRDLGLDEVTAARDAAGGDLDRMAAALRVSRRALQLRMRELGLR